MELILFGILLMAAAFTGSFIWIKVSKIGELDVGGAFDDLVWGILFVFFLGIGAIAILAGLITEIT
ncbi:MAG TPA: hypothetical protein VIK81_03315 [Patescibacteria group bacterium]